MEPVRTNGGLGNFDSAAIKQRTMTYTTSRSIHAVSTNPITMNSPQPSTPCLGGIKTQQDATCICPMFRYGHETAPFFI